LSFFVVANGELNSIDLDVEPEEKGELFIAGGLAAQVN